MTSGTIMHWRVAEGEQLPESGLDIAFSVRPTGLTDDPEDGSPILEVESHEEGFLARILLAEGESAAPDEAIAVVVEREQDVEAVQAAFAVGQSRPFVEAGTFAWQAYLAAGEQGRACSNS